MRVTTRHLLAALIAGPALFGAAAASAGTFSILYSFGAQPGDVTLPILAPAASNGVLYGVTEAGGAGGDGAFYAFDLASSTETTVAPLSGLLPQTITYSGNKLFGASAYPSGGSIYEVVLKKDKAKPIYDFGQAGDWVYPGAIVSEGAKLYGSTEAGGANGYGSVFTINPATGVLTTIYAFQSTNDGYYPQNLVAQSGLLYGVATFGGQGGSAGYGTIFTVNPTTGAETTLYAFTGKQDGGLPIGITFYQGLIYGNTGLGGTNNNGTLFVFNPLTQQLSTLYSYPNDLADTCGLGVPVVENGRAFGITATCSTPSWGALYEVTLKTGRRRLVHKFLNSLKQTGGGLPQTGLLAYHGVIYGVTENGGAYDGGTIFSYTP